MHKIHSKATIGFRIPLVTTLRAQIKAQNFLKILKMTLALPIFGFYNKKASTDLIKTMLMAIFLSIFHQKEVSLRKSRQYTLQIITANSREHVEDAFFGEFTESWLIADLSMKILANFALGQHSERFFKQPLVVVPPTTVYAAWVYKRSFVKVCTALQGSDHYLSFEEELSESQNFYGVLVGKPIGEKVHGPFLVHLMVRENSLVKEIAKQKAMSGIARVGLMENFNDFCLVIADGVACNMSVVKVLAILSQK